ncbi:MAG: dinitrogenase iron-molybdenum cofactor biosynthesis protein [Gammaproteobacteria bacterium]
MPKETLSRALALRIGLAARVLPDIDPSALVRLLDACVGRPFSEDKFRQLTPRRLRMASRGALSGVDPDVLRQAVQWLQGEMRQEEEPPLERDPPQPQCLNNGEIPNSLRVAVASDNGERLDGHFGSCSRFLIYQVSIDEIRLIDIRPTAAAPQSSDEKNAYRAMLIGDCHLLYVVAIGGPAAAKVVRAGIHPLKEPESGDARQVIAHLQGVLRGTPPPWLARAMQVPKPPAATSLAMRGQGQPIASHG